MAKIDVKQIEGYEKMTAEEKLAALESYDTPEPDYSGYVPKATFDKTASELAEWKRKHHDLLSEEEKKKTETAEELEKLRAQVADMTKEKMLADYKARFIALGYEEALAEETAKAWSEGNALKVFDNQKKFLEAHDKAYKAQLMGGTPTPPSGGGANDIMTLEKLRAMSPSDRYEFSVKNPDEYQRLYDGGNN